MEHDVERHFVKAQEFIREAESLIASSLYKASIGHAYKAMLEAARGAIEGNKVEEDSRKTVFSIFEEAFVKTGRLDKKFGNYLQDAAHARIDSSDTPIAMIEFRQAQMILVKAKDFIAQCRNLCS